MKLLVVISTLFAFSLGSPIEKLLLVRGPEGRIIGGQEVLPHALPYQVGIYIFKQEGEFWCGGSLISRTLVLTAAHCIDTAYKVNVLLGAHDISKNETGRTVLELSKSNLIVHRNWDLEAVQNDIALIRLPQAVTLNRNIQLINLPSRDQVDETFVGDKAVASGWGLISDHAESVTTRLRFVEVPIASPTECRNYFGYGIQDQHICVSGQGIKGACSGDSGGPLAIENNDGTKTVVGIASFVGPDGCEAGWPTVYTRVTYFLDWISRNSSTQVGPWPPLYFASFFLFQMLLSFSCS